MWIQFCNQIRIQALLQYISAANTKLGQPIRIWIQANATDPENKLKLFEMLKITFKNPQIVSLNKKI